MTPKTRKTQPKLIVKDITNLVRTGMVDDELTPVLRCVCGATYEDWQVTISIYEDDPKEMQCCGAKLYFSNRVTVWQVKDSR